MSKDDVKAIGEGARMCQCRECSGVPDGEYWTDQVCTDAFRQELRGVTDEDVACEVAAIASEVEATGGTAATVSVLREAARRLRRTSPQGEAIEGWSRKNGMGFVPGGPVEGHPEWIRIMIAKRQYVPATLILHPQGEETGE